MTTTSMTKSDVDPEDLKTLSPAQIKALGPTERLDYNFKRFRAMVMMRKDELSASMPRHVDANRILRIALTEIRKTPKLLECDVASLLTSVATASSLGLEIGGPLGQAYLVPYGPKAELVLGYRGMLAMARRSGEIKSIEARPVFEGDAFSYSYGLTPSLVHTPSGETDPTKLRAAYAIAHFKDGGFQLEVMLANEIRKIRDVALAKNFNKGPWKDNESEMWRKTPLRRLMKMLPLSADIAERVDVEDKIERGLPVADAAGAYDSLTGEEIPEHAGELEGPKQ